MAIRGRDIPHLFGRGGRDRALIALAVNGATYVRELARMIGSDSSSTFRMVESLSQTGLVVKRDRDGGRKYVALNRGKRYYAALHRLLLALNRRSPIERIDQPQRWGMPYSSEMDPGDTSLIFQSPVRSQTLLFIGAMGETNVCSIYDSLGLDTVSVSNAIRHWKQQGVIRDRMFRANRLVELNPTFYAAVELRQFISSVLYGHYDFIDTTIVPKMTMKATIAKGAIGRQPKRRRQPKL